MKKLVSILALFSSTIVALIFLFLLYFTIPLISDSSFLKNFNIMPLLTSTLAIATLATTFALFYSIAIAIFSYSLNKRFKNYIESFFVVLSSIPTVVYAFLGVILVVPFVRNIANCSGYSLIAAAFVLSFMITPTIVLFLKDSFNATPTIYKDIIYSLGGKREDFELEILLKYNKKAIIVASIMGFSRAIGDTMIALMVSGNAINYPNSLTTSIRALTAHIALVFGEDFNSIEFKTIFASGLILFIISATIIIIIKRLNGVK